MNQELLLIRGLPGSGKTTQAKQYAAQGYVHLEADMFFETNGEYRFNQALIAKAHDWCIAKAKEALWLGKSVVVANTFTRLWEFQKYTAFAKRYAIPIRVIEATGNFQNHHGVSPELLEQMRQRYEKI